MTAVFLFVFGLIVGSFLNVLAFRYDPEGRFFSFKKWTGRSHCLFCSQQLKWYELIPVLSFIIQEGRCLVCRRKLSWQYPLVELASGLAFLLPYYFNFNWVLSVLWILIFIIFILIWAIDFRLMVIPDELIILLAALGLILIDQTAGLWWNHLAAALSAAFFLGAIILLSRGKAMGMGDLKLVAVLGLIFGWPDIVLVLALAFIIGAIVGLFLLAFGKKKFKDAIPFGPFLILSSSIVVFFSQTIIEKLPSAFQALIEKILFSLL